MEKTIGYVCSTVYTGHSTYINVEYVYHSKLYYGMEEEEISYVVNCLNEFV